MERRRLGKTGLEVSVLSFGCGAVGGLMTRGEPADQERAVARALELGINYFATPEIWWVQWVFLGWGIGVLAHWLLVFGSSSSGGNWITRWQLRKIKEIKDKM